MQWSTGKIVFNTARVVSTNNFVRISVGSYFTATQLDASHTWSLQLKQLTKDTTCFQATSAWASNTPTIKTSSGKIETYRNEDRVSKELGNLLGLQLFVDKTNNVRWQCYGIITGANPKVDVNNVETQEIDFQVVRDAYFLTS
jgi:hypothetical protein